MAKRKVDVKASKAIPAEVFVQRVVDGNDTYLLVYENIEDIDLEQGDIVGAYSRDRIIQVHPGQRYSEEIKG